MRDVHYAAAERHILFCCTFTNVFCKTTINDFVRMYTLE